MHLVSKAFESTAEGIFITNERADIISINKAFTEITGFSPDEVLGEQTHLFQSEHRDQEFFDQLWDSLDVTGRWQGEIWNRNKDGEIFPEWLTISTVKNERGEVTNYIGVFTDITARKKSEERLRYLATHDPLTDLPNRDLFHDRLNHALARARRTRKETAILLLDLDNFKNINDTLGHSTGDRLLQIVAERLKACLRKSDTVARMGGDEFTFILEQIPNTNVCVIVAQKILHTLTAPFMISEHRFSITASIGISIFPDHGLDPETLLSNADKAMYRAKIKGNNYAFYEPNDNYIKKDESLD
jgi:diguanylate cyclase (GGDEF)-like protein/PAS domain S-box-containing protein